LIADCRLPGVWNPENRKSQIWSITNRKSPINAMEQPELEELIEQWFEGELTAQELRELREALETRLDQQAEEIAEGLVDPDSPEMRLRQETLQAQLETLRQEEFIARFVEESLRALLTEEEILGQWEE
jgi:hypothetical protein